LADESKVVKFGTKGREYIFNLGERSGDDYPLVYHDIPYNFEAAERGEFVLAIVPYFHDDGHAWLISAQLDGTLKGIPLERIRD
jgi:hypothetical protein